MTFSERMRPKQIAALIGNEQARLEVLKWLKNWKLGSRAILLSGPPGVGKSTTVYSVAAELGYTVVEYNASDVRTKSKLAASLGAALQNQSLFGQDERLLIFLDEVDGLSGRADYAGADYILEFIENSSVPVAMAENVEDDPKLKKLEQKSQVVRFGPVNEGLVLVYLRSIASREGLAVSEESLKRISRICRGDVRYALNLLQTVPKDSATQAETDKQFFSDSAALEAILSSVSIGEAIAKFRQFDASPFDKLRFIFDSVVSSKTLSEEDRWESLELISQADLLLQKINRNQRWRLLRYLDRYLALAILSKRLKRSESNIPWNLKIAIWNDGRVVKRLLQDLPSDYHVGKYAFSTYYLPYLSFYFKNRPEEMKRFLSQHEYSDSEKRVLLKLASSSSR